MCENNAWRAPLWLTEDYLEEILKKYLKDKTVVIRNVDIKPATAAGENYISLMSRIKISFNTAKGQQLQKLSFIMKSSFENDPFLTQMMCSYDVYNTEMKMYEQILPQLAEILQECGETEQLFANTLKVDYERSAIIFEDLTEHNYVMADRVRGLDDNHAHLVIEKLAKYHAAGAVLNERQNGALENFDHGLLNRHSRGLACYYENLTEAAANFAKTCPELGEYYYDKLMKLIPHLVDYGTRAYASNSKHFYSLNHGDLWINNMMMLYDAKSVGKQLQNIMFIDFQFCNWSSVAVDLYYFFNTSLEPKLVVDTTAQEKLVQYYHSVLSAMLKKLKYSGHIPTLHELCIQLEEGRILAVMGLLTNRAVASNNLSKDADIYCLLNADERAKKFHQTCYQVKDFQNVVKKMLPYFDRHGLLDLHK